MNGLVGLVLGALLGANLLAGGLADTLRTQLAEAMPSARGLAVEVSAGGDRPRFGCVESVRATMRGVDARELPLASLVPIPRPGSPKGRIGRIEVVAEDVRLDQFRARSMRFVAEEVVYDLPTAMASGRMRVTSLGDQRLEVRFADGDLDEFAAAAYPELTNPRLTFEGERLVLRAEVTIFLAVFPAAVAGRLAIADGHQLLLRDAEFQTGRVELTESLREELLTRLNPLLDLDLVFGFPVPIVWDSIEVHPGEAVLTGRLEAPPATPRRREFEPRRKYLE